MGRKKPLKIEILKRFDKLYLRDGGLCWICGLWGPVIVFNRDHLIPRSLGGSNGLWNLRLAHPDCNARRDRLAPPLTVVLAYCYNDDMKERAKRMYYRAYPHLKDKHKPDPGEPPMVMGMATPSPNAMSQTCGPPSHKKYKSQSCSLCYAWCATCKTCWCSAYENDHDVLKIRRPSLAVGFDAPS